MVAFVKNLKKSEKNKIGAPHYISQNPFSIRSSLSGMMDMLGGIFGGVASESLSVFRKITIRPSEEVLNLQRLVSNLPYFTLLTSG